jgi:hypothetical protein
MRQVVLIRDKDHSDKLQDQFACLRRTAGKDGTWFEEYWTSRWGVPLEDLRLYVLQTTLMQLSEEVKIALWNNKTGETWTGATERALLRLPNGRCWLKVLTTKGPKAFALDWLQQPFAKIYPAPLREALRRTLLRPTSKTSVNQALTLCARLRDYAFFRRIVAADKDIDKDKTFIIPIGEGHIWHLSKLLREANFTVKSGPPVACSQRAKSL